MSAIAGLVRFDGAPVDPATVSRMSARMELRGFLISAAGSGPATLLFGRAPFLVSAQVNPLFDPQRGVLAVFDGRLDNRDDLTRQLGVAADLDDVAIVAVAYRKWSNAFVEHLLGEFALAVVDVAERRVVCARDQLGVRNLHYRAGDGWFAFASAIDVLAAGILPVPGINEGMVGEYLSSFVVDRQETVFDGVLRVPPACVIIAGDQRHELREYWSPSPLSLAYTRDEEYEEHARDVLTQAVAARLRSSSAVGVMLSGGLDSSAVTGVAVELIRQRRVAAPAVESFSASVPGLDDEQPFFDAVNRKWGITAHRIEERRPVTGQLKNEITTDLEPQLMPHSPTMDVLRAAVRARGIEVLLTGMGGDDWFGSGPAAYADLFRRGRLIALARRIAIERGEDHFAGWRMALQSIVWPLLPPDAKAGIRFVLRRGLAPAWIDAAFARRINLADRLAAFRSRRQFATLEQDDNWWQSMSGFHVHQRENVARGGDRFGLTLSHPYYDRRVIEFALALPAEQLARKGRVKVLLRRAMRASIPEEVAARRVSPAADHAFLKLLEVEAGPRPFSDLQVEARHWIDGAVVRSMSRRLHAGGAAQAATNGRILWGIQAVDHWLGALTVLK